MAASPEASGSDRPLRRRRYERRPGELAGGLTARRLRLLGYVADYRVVSLPQLTRLDGSSHESTRRQMRALFDLGLVEVVAVSRSVLADPLCTNGADLLFGSAPNVYVLSRAGQRLLYEAGWLSEAGPLPTYGPRNSLFLAHELAVRDMRVWLECCARAHQGHGLRQWHDGPAAVIDLGTSHTSRRLRPDAWFVYGIGASVLVGLLEVDRGTERGSRRWADKVAAYGVLFRGSRLRETTGYVNARVLVATNGARRRDTLATLVCNLADREFQERFWFADLAAFDETRLDLPVWRLVAATGLWPLVSITVPAASEPPVRPP